MEQPRLISVNARIGSEELGLEVEIRLRQLDGRWLAVADFGGEPEVGIGATPRVALAAAFATLGERADQVRADESASAGDQGLGHVGRVWTARRS